MMQISGGFRPMFSRTFFYCSLLGAPALAATIPFDCNLKIPLQTAVTYALPGETLLVSGSCYGPLTISGKSITIAGNGTVSLDGRKGDAVTVRGPGKVTLKNLSIGNGQNGIVEQSGAQLQLTGMSVHNNAVNGILLEGNSAITITDSSINHNAVSGIDAEANSSVILTGNFQSEANGVFGININNASSLTLANAKATVDQNTLGVQIGTSAGAFIADPNSVLTVKNNATTGLTIVSGAHMVDFGGTINATDNQVHGVSVDSKAGLDLDAAGSLVSTGNTQDGVHLEETSVLTIFNTTAFSGAPGSTTLTTQNNGQNGISVLTGSNLTVIHQATINSNHNARFGIQADNGSSITLIQSDISKNSVKDIELTFGSRGDLNSSTIGTLACDRTVILRGSTAFTCPQ
jgi:hypothetical protein